MKLDFYDLHVLRVSLCVYVCASVSFECLKQSLWILVCMSCIWAHLNGVLMGRIYESLPLVCVSVCVSFLWLLGKGSVIYIPPFIAGQRIGKHVPAATNTHSSRKIVRLLYLRVCACILLSLLGNTSVKTFPRQRRIVGGFVFCAGPVVSKKVGSYPQKFFLILWATLAFQPGTILVLGWTLTARSSGRRIIA
jgi:hypothetical protein